MSSGAASPNRGIGKNIDVSIVVWDSLLQQRQNAQTICLKLIWKAQLYCPGICRNTNDWAVVSVSALYAAAYAENTPLGM